MDFKVFFLWKRGLENLAKKKYAIFLNLRVMYVSCTGHSCTGHVRVIHVRRIDIWPGNLWLLLRIALGLALRSFAFLEICMSFVLLAPQASTAHPLSKHSVDLDYVQEGGFGAG